MRRAKRTVVLKKDRLGVVTQLQKKHGRWSKKKVHTWASNPIHPTGNPTGNPTGTQKVLLELKPIFSKWQDPFCLTEQMNTIMAFHSWSLRLYQNTKGFYSLSCFLSPKQQVIMGQEKKEQIWTQKIFFIWYKKSQGPVMRFSRVFDFPAVTQLVTLLDDVYWTNKDTQNLSCLKISSPGSAGSAGGGAGLVQ